MPPSNSSANGTARCLTPATIAGWLLGHGWSLHRPRGVAALGTAGTGRTRPPRRSIRARPPLALGQRARDGACWNRLVRGEPRGRADPARRTRSRHGHPARDRFVARGSGRFRCRRQRSWQRRFSESRSRLAALGVTGCHDPGELTGDADIARGASLLPPDGRDRPPAAASPCVDPSASARSRRRSGPPQRSGARPLSNGLAEAVRRRLARLAQCRAPCAVRRRGNQSTDRWSDRHGPDRRRGARPSRLPRPRTLASCRRFTRSAMPRCGWCWTSSSESPRGPRGNRRSCGASSTPSSSIRPTSHGSARSASPRRSSRFTFEATPSRLASPGESAPRTPSHSARSSTAAP